ncbi:MAG TPA: hypothetical protein VFE24_01750 [Pirellulales bacterium]|nr:hypothetical protein [Pirellulales bacterium]
MQLTDYKGIQVLDSYPANAGGLALNNDFKGARQARALFRDGGPHGQQ